MYILSVAELNWITAPYLVPCISLLPFRLLFALVMEIHARIFVYIYVHIFFMYNIIRGWNTPSKWSQVTRSSVLCALCLVLVEHFTELDVHPKTFPKITNQIFSITQFITNFWLPHKFPALDSSAHIIKSN